jgi:hypothetical protein
MEVLEMIDKWYGKEAPITVRCGRVLTTSEWYSITLRKVKSRYQ